MSTEDRSKKSETIALLRQRLQALESNLETLDWRSLANLSRSLDAFSPTKTPQKNQTSKWKNLFTDFSWLAKGMALGVLILVILLGLQFFAHRPSLLAKNNFSGKQNIPAESIQPIQEKQNIPPLVVAKPKVIPKQTEAENSSVPAIANEPNVLPKPEVIAEKPQEIITKPKLKLTPEQSLIAAIQTQVAEITDQYSEDLIESIQANFFASLLTVTVRENWYTLSTSRQEKIATDMLIRCRSLDFKKLEIVDSNNLILARSPVVGNKMVFY